MWKQGSKGDISLYVFGARVTLQTGGGDICIILHAKYRSLIGSKFVVVSPDTDVLMLLIHHFDVLNLKHLFFKTGRRQLHCTNTRYLSVHDIVNALFGDQKRILLPPYCPTGCDFCSAFFGTRLR